MVLTRPTGGSQRFWDKIQLLQCLFNSTHNNRLQQQLLVFYVKVLHQHRITFHVYLPWLEIWEREKSNFTNTHWIIFHGLKIQRCLCSLLTVFDLQQPLQYTKHIKLCTSNVLCLVIAITVHTLRKCLQYSFGVVLKCELWNVPWSVNCEIFLGVNCDRFWSVLSGGEV